MKEGTGTRNLPPDPWEKSGIAFPRALRYLSRLPGGPNPKIWDGCNFGPPYIVCFFDALRKPVTRGRKALKGPARAVFGTASLSNPVKKQALARKPCPFAPLKNFWPPAARAGGLVRTMNHYGMLDGA